MFGPGSAPLLVLLAALLVGACQPPTRRAEAAWQALTAARFERLDLATPAFVLTAALRDEDPSHPLHVYIEGDGHAWLRRDRPARDPTPLHPVAAELAARDPAPAVLYLARPCQWRPETTSGGCAPELWTSHRYAPAVVDAYAALIEDMTRGRATQRVALVGHSGGGALAALLATKLPRVDWLLTVAANLDTAAWTAHHGVSPLDASLNPADFARELHELPQLHLVGAEDPIVPELVARAWARRGGIDQHSIRVVPGADHHCCWAEGWSDTLAWIAEGRRNGGAP
jgi:pimeloyl-ACP methyl ester carboxylesterase